MLENSVNIFLRRYNVSEFLHSNNLIGEKNASNIVHGGFRRLLDFEFF